MKKECIICGSKLKGRRLKYCSKKCANSYSARMNNKKWIKQTKEAKKRWYEKNKERLIAKQREWEKANPERTKINHKKAMDKFVASGKMKKYMADYYQNNKEKCRIRFLTNYYKKPLMIYLGSKCQKCGSTKDLEFHHKSYDLDQDKNKLDQLKRITILLCKKCHKKHHNSVI